MLTVEQTLRALRQDILAALADEAPLPGGATLVADRVSVSLAVQIDPIKATAEERGRFVVVPEPTPGSHHVTVDFRVEPPASAGGQLSLASPAPSTAPKSRTSGADEPVFTTLAEVFGAPGFDSSARATVFREALEELTEEQRRHVLVSLRDLPALDEEPAVSQARHLVRRLASSGPAGPERGPELLRQLAARNPVQALVEAAASRWRTQSEWAAAAPAAD